jgi:hypothetical protein
MIQGYEQMFGRLPKRNIYSPLEKGDHPELGTSELCNPRNVQKYQSLVGSLKWAVSIRRINITTAVMPLSSVCAVPRTGHLERAKRVVSYVACFKEVPYASVLLSLTIQISQISPTIGHTNTMVP